LGNSRLTPWRFAWRPKVFFCRNSGNRALLHQILPYAVTISTTNVSINQFGQTGSAENRPATTRAEIVTSPATIKSATLVEAKGFVMETSAKSKKRPPFPKVARIYTAVFSNSIE
jgi:hypothetical protein